MKTTTNVLALGLALASLAGCSVAARSPDMYRDDTKAVLDTKSNDIRACYDTVLSATPGVGGKVTVKFDVETEQGKIVNVTVDQTNTTAPAPVAECVTKNVAGLGLTPADANLGKGTFVYDFQAPPPPAPSPVMGKALTAPKS